MTTVITSIRTSIATIRTIRYSPLFAVRYSRLFAVRYSRLFAIRYSGFPDTQTQAWIEVRLFLSQTNKSMTVNTTTLSQVC